MTNIYARDVSHIKTLDPYRLQELYKMHPCAEHVVKKLLVAGERSGGKSLDQDIKDCIDTLQRWQAMREEDAPVSTRLYDWGLVPVAFEFVFRGPGGGAYGTHKPPIWTGMQWQAYDVAEQLKGLGVRPMLGVDIKGTLERRP